MPPVAGVRQAIHVLKIDLTRPGIALEVGGAGDEAGLRAETTSSFVRRNGLAAAVNGGFFEPFRSGTFWGDDYYPRAGEPVRVVEAAPHLGMRATICIVPPARVTIEPGTKCPSPQAAALTAGPLLLEDGADKPLGGLVVRHPRTAFGTSADRRTAWMVVVDGRQPGWSAGATLAEMREIFRRLGASDAINLDGGGSTTMVLDDASEPRVINSPIHTGVPGRERPNANHLGVRARPYVGKDFLSSAQEYDGAASLAERRLGA